MPPTYDDAARWLVVDTPLGRNQMFATGVTVREAVSELFEIRVDALSPLAEIAPERLLGLRARVTLAADQTRPRAWTGRVARFSAGGAQVHELRSYELTLVPDLYVATLNRACRIFQDKSVPEIIREVLGAYPGLRFDLGLVNGRHPAHPYRVQWRESDFAFLSRLMEEEGIFYLFRHDAQGHRLVLADHPAAWEDIHEPELEIDPNAVLTKALLDFRRDRSLAMPRHVRRDYDFEKPLADLTAHAEARGLPPSPAIAPEVWDAFDWPGRYVAQEDGAALTEVAADRAGAVTDRAVGRASHREIAPGGVFRLARHGAAPEVGRHWAVVAALHSASDPSLLTGEDGSRRYECAFEAVPKGTPWRPPRRTPKPEIGTQTAFVVGPKGEEIHADRHGRVKVRFHWDRADTKDEEASCWIRVAQGWAGRGWGAWLLPRVGMEVVVEFLDGDPDRPLIVGCLHNAEALPTFGPEADKPAAPHGDGPGGRRATQSGLRTHTLKGGADQANELSFDDRPNAEQVFLQAQRNFDVRVKNALRAQIDGLESRRVAKTRRTGIGGDDHLVIGGDFRIAVQGDATAIIVSDAGRQIGGDWSEAVRGAVHIVAARSITLQSGGAFIRISPSGIDIEGPRVNLNCGAAAPRFHDPTEPAQGPDPVASERAAQGQARPDKPPPAPIPPLPRGPDPALAARQRAALLQAAASRTPLVEVCG